MSHRLLVGHVLDKMRELPDCSVNCIVTSIPYWGLRDYGLPPVVWGGDAGCEHDWTGGAVARDKGAKRQIPHGDGRVNDSYRDNRVEVPTTAIISDVREETKNGKSRTTDRCNGAESRTFDGNHQKHVMPGSTCSKCGAWLGCLGLEPTPQMFVQHIVDVFREARRVLRKDGTCWVNIGDSYCSGTTSPRNSHPAPNGAMPAGWTNRAGSVRSGSSGTLKPKDRCMIPARVAIALQDDGWWLRDEIIWAKPNPMPSSVTDRTTPAHEMIYLLTKSRKYWYDADAIKEPTTGNAHARGDGVNPKAASAGYKMPDNWAVGPGAHGTILAEGRLKGKTPGKNSRVNITRNGGAPPQSRQNESFSAAVRGLVDTRNKRSVWTIATQPFPEAHFATFPEELPKLCILAGCPEGGTVMDLFGGSGTTVAVAEALGRNGIYIDQSEEYAQIARKRILAVTGSLFAVQTPPETPQGAK